MVSYHKIVFGIKHGYKISDILKIIKKQAFNSILISQHSATDVDDCCDRPDVHYHGLVEYSNGEVKKENLLVQLSPYCYYIKENSCCNPAEYLAYITLEPKRIIAQEILDSSKLSSYLQTASNKIELLRRKKLRKISLIERNNKIIKIVELFLKSGHTVNIEISKKKNEYLRMVSPKVLETVLNLVQKIVLNSSILVLSNRFDLQSGSYLTPVESARFVLDWCSFQKLDPKEFIKNLILCLDKKGGNRNSIYLQGSRNSGKNYIVQSIIEACIHVGQVVVESSAYSFVWENCVDKRLIVMLEPHFSKVNFDQLDKILSGSGTLIYKHNDVVDYVLPTPVIILANAHDWTDDPQLRDRIEKRFLCSYTDLTIFPHMIEKKLHPRWLSLLNSMLVSKNSSNADQKDSKISDGTTFKSNFDTENGIQSMTEEPLNDGGKIASGNSLKTEISGITPVAANERMSQISMNSKQGSENTRQLNSNSGKRPIGDIENEGGRNKMNRVDMIKK